MTSQQLYLKVAECVDKGQAEVFHQEKHKVAECKYQIKCQHIPKNQLFGSYFECPKWHSQEDKRRTVFLKEKHKINYNRLYFENCENFQEKGCNNIFEYFYHPHNYRTKECPSLKKKVLSQDPLQPNPVCILGSTCPFYHSIAEREEWQMNTNYAKYRPIQKEKCTQGIIDDINNIQSNNKQLEKLFESIKLSQEQISQQDRPSQNKSTILNKEQLVDFTPTTTTVIGNMTPVNISLHSSESSLSIIESPKNQLAHLSLNDVTFSEVHSFWFWYQSHKQTFDDNEAIEESDISDSDIPLASPPPIKAELSFKIELSLNLIEKLKTQFEGSTASASEVTNVNSTNTLNTSSIPTRNEIATVNKVKIKEPAVINIDPIISKKPPKKPTEKPNPPPPPTVTPKKPKETNKIINPIVSIISRGTKYAYKENMVISESTCTEFKNYQTLSNCGKVKDKIIGHNQNDYGQYISGFLNHKGGTMYIGVHDDGWVDGIALNPKQKEWFATLIELTVAQIEPKIEQGEVRLSFSEVSGKSKYQRDTENYVIELIVTKPKSTELYFYNGQAFIKKSASLYQMSVGEIKSDLLVKIKKQIKKDNTLVEQLIEKKDPAVLKQESVANLLKFESLLQGSIQKIKTAISRKQN